MLYWLQHLCTFRYDEFGACVLVWPLHRGICTHCMLAMCTDAILAAAYRTFGYDEFGPCVLLHLLHGVASLAYDEGQQLQEQGGGGGGGHNSYHSQL
jgi:hypothetical protein